MRILVACERSGRVRDAFIAKGHDAISCDIVSSDRPGPHIIGNVLDVLGDGWDMMVAFPPCTYLSKVNARRWEENTDRRRAALDFVWTLMTAPIPRIAIENPVGAIGTNIRPADQYIDPWMFGEPYKKRTGLWLLNLPRLVPEVTIMPEEVVRFVNGGRPDRRGGRPSGGARSPRKRARTFEGIARAMAQQWGRLGSTT